MGSGSLPCDGVHVLQPILQPDDSVRRWLAATLPLVAAPFFTELEAVPVSPASPVITATGKAPRKRSRQRQLRNSSIDALIRPAGAHL
jgi:hypothetical protein